MRRRSGQPAHDPVEVELLDGLPDLDEGARADPTERPEPLTGEGDRPEGAGRRRRLSLPALALVAAAAVVGVVAANVAEVRGEAARRAAALAVAPGFLAPLDEPLAVSWELPGGFGWITDPLVIISDGTGRRAVDPVTGAVVWSRPSEAEGEYCSPVGAAFEEWEALWRDRSVIEVPGPRLLGCGSWAAPGERREASFGEIGVDVIDAATGTVLHRLSTFGAVVCNLPVGGEVVFAVLDPEGTLTVQRWDPATGELLSAATSTEPVSSTGGRAILPRVELFGDALVVNGDSEVAFLLTTGREIDPVDVPTEARGWRTTVHLADGATATWTDASDGGSDGAGAVVEADGTERFALPGPPAGPWISDGSLPDVVLVSGPTGALVALDAVTGEELWATEQQAGASALTLVDGTLVVRQGGRILALDGRDGSVTWEAETVAEFWMEGLTDGELVLLYEADPDGPELVAHEMSDGLVRWRTPLPPGTQELQVTPDGRVVGSTQDSVFGMGT